MATKKAKPSKKAPVKANPVGRPTAYRDAYCVQLIKHMEQGLSFESFAGLIGVSKQTIYDWEKVNPKFLDAKDIGLQKARLYFERQGIKGMNGKISFFNDRIWRMMMINKFKEEWRDKVENDNRNVNINSEQLTKEEIIAISKALENDC